MAWTLQDTQEARRFYLPVWKTDFSGFVEAGDTVRVLLNSDDGILKAAVLVLTGVSEDGRTLYWERDATALYVTSQMVFAVHSQHNFNCPEAVNLELLGFDTGDNTVDAFTINGVATTGDWDPATSGDEVLLEDAMNEVLLGNGYATVISDGTEFTFYVMNTTAEVSVTNVVTAVPLTEQA